MLSDLDRDVLMETGALIDAAGGTAKALAGDLTATDFPDKLVKATVDGFGSLDFIVNNAGYTWDNVIQKTTDEQFQAMLDIHVVAPFRVLRAARVGLVAEKPRGAVVTCLSPCKLLIPLGTDPGDPAQTFRVAG